MLVNSRGIFTSPAEKSFESSRVSSRRKKGFPLVRFCSEVSKWGVGVVDVMRDTRTEVSGFDNPVNGA